MTVTERQMKSAIKKYNDIMYSVCYEYKTIGTGYSENTEQWNLRDMVAECDYILSTYYEQGHLNEEMRNSDDANERKMWRSDTGKLRRFINHYDPFVDDMRCHENHCSRFDNA